MKAVLFDIGNVFVRWDPRYLYEKLITDPAELDFFLENVVTLAWHTHHDAGRTFAEGREILARDYPQYLDLIAAYDTRWTETIGELLTGTVEVLEALRAKGIPCYALTNFSAEKWPHFERSYAFTQHFAGVVVSGEEGLVKPDPQIFQLCIDRFGLDPKQTRFIDDRAENVQAAETLGFKGHIFTNSDMLKRDMQKTGVL